jgi:aldose 1-epimerase
MSAPASASVQRQAFGRTASGLPVELFTLSNSHGLRADIMNYGATIVRLWVPDRESNLADVVLGYDSVEAYEAGKAYHGAVVGRVGNRIAGGRFVLDGCDHELPTNNAPCGEPCTLHGGPEGFDRQVWRAEPRVEGAEAVLELTHFSSDGHMGFPGNLSARVTYRLTPENGLQVIYDAETDAPTVVNLTQHAYFNLAGEGAGRIDDHVLQLAASKFLPVSPGLIPTGQRELVVGTPFDFVAPRPIGGQMDEEHVQLTIGDGYDHCWVFDEPGPDKRLVAAVLEQGSGRLMELWTTEPGVQFYTGNMLDENDAGKGGQRYGRRAGFCLETQHFPDSPNRAEFPSVVLRPGEHYHSETEFRFGTA